MAGGKKKSRKTRVAFQKNRNKRSRQQDLTRLADDPDALADLESGERLSGKGELTRYRTIVTDQNDQDAVRQVDESACSPGRVLAAVGATQIRVQLESGKILVCTVRRLVRTLARDSRNAVVAGDRVLVSSVTPETGVIERVEPRAGTVSRVSRNVEHVIVSHVDQAVIVASVAEPDLKLGLIDRFLCSVARGGVNGIVCINKTDLGTLFRLQPIAGSYAQLGYPVVLTNALTGEGIPRLRELLRDRETVFAGQSGVGKSSLLNAIQPGLGRPTSEVSSDTSKGRHTTRVTELLPLDGGGWVVDTPGIRQLQLWDIIPEEVEGHFVEFRPFVARCHFPDCTHMHETGCAVKQAVRQGRISPLRYESYARIFTGDDD